MDVGMVLLIAVVGVALVLALGWIFKARRKVPALGNAVRAIPADGDFAAIARIVMEGAGGKDNIGSVDNCITRLRLEVRDPALVDEKKIKSAGIAGIIRQSKTAVQVIIGTQAQHVADEFKKLM